MRPPAWEGRSRWSITVVGYNSDLQFEGIHSIQLWQDKSQTPYPCDTPESHKWGRACLRNHQLGARRRPYGARQRCAKASRLHIPMYQVAKLDTTNTKTCWGIALSRICTPWDSKLQEGIMRNSIHVCAVYIILSFAISPLEKKFKHI